eukprot:216483_1
MMMTGINKHQIIETLGEYDLYWQLFDHQILFGYGNINFNINTMAVMIFGQFFKIATNSWNEQKDGHILQTLIQYRRNMYPHGLGIIPIIDVDAIIGYYFSHLGNYEKANYYFVEPALSLINHQGKKK